MRQPKNPMLTSMRNLQPEIRRRLRIGILDIETTSLRGDYGGMLVCAVIKDYWTGKNWTVRIDDKNNPDIQSDRWVCQELVNRIRDKYDLLVTWNGTMFDLRFIDTRCYKNWLPLLPPIYHRDILWHARSKLVIRSRSLVVVHGYLFGQSSKTQITEKVWGAMLLRKKWAIDYMVHHCRIDVKETLDIYKVFLPNLSKTLKKR